jgi:hypothetical protein
MTGEFKQIYECKTMGLLNQKLFKVIGRDHEVNKNEMDPVT